MAADRIVWYVADPMCSWCWGFSPVIDAIETTYRDCLTVTMVMGGLRPGTTAPMPPAQRAEILHHWQEVQRRTGQAFTFEGAMPDGFVYDTEPPCRALVAITAINPALTRAYFERVQAAFYMEGLDVTRPVDHCGGEPWWRRDRRPDSGPHRHVDHVSVLRVHLFDERGFLFG
jgi:putative protein-disulfide isomerase